jgi:3-deoxy-D-arabino-heptulosonate 7-phosphate (DAHP) synthase
VHPCTEKAMSDGAQSLNFTQFHAMMQQLSPYLNLWKETRATSTPRAAAAV